MTILLRDQGVFTKFPWLSATTLNSSFADHHFLYHLALIPFVGTPLPLIGLKLATILFASLAVTGFGWLLSKLDVRGAHWYAAILLTINPFVFRLGLMKAQGLALLALWIGLYLAFQRNYLGLLCWMTVCVWVYGGWPLLPALVVIWLVVGGAWTVRHHGLLPIRSIRHRWLISAAKTVLVLGVGVLMGLVFSPYFPHNLSFYWQQIVSIALVNYQDVLNVGREWYPYNFRDLAVDAPLIVILWTVGVAALITNSKKQSAQAWTWFAYSIAFLILTGKSRRNVEYLVPFIVGFAAISISAIVPTLQSWIKQKGFSFLWNYIPLALYVATLPLGIYGVARVRQDFDRGISLNSLRGPAEWIAAHAPIDSVVMHSDWDDFPPLWYYNHQQRYIVGLDPTFLYLESPQQSKLFTAITTGSQQEHVAETIMSAFGASYVVIGDTDHQKFDAVLAADPAARLVYSDEQAKVYALFSTP
jgi:hypothetical protein